MTSVTVRHNFETAHRLPQLGGKCASLHGHSWWCEVTVTGTPGQDGVLVDFADLKRGVRGWLDSYLDHGAMLGDDDPLNQPLRNAGCKVYTFGGDEAAGLAWPTVENVAELLARVTDTVLADMGVRSAHCTRVRVTETGTNAAEVTR